MADFLVVLTGGLFLVIIPLIPKLLRLRLRFLRWIRWEWAAKRLEKHFQGQTWLLRILFFVVGIHFFYLHVSFSWREWLFEVRRLQPWRWLNVDVQRRTFTILRCRCPSYSPCLWLTMQETRRVDGKRDTCIRFADSYTIWRCPCSQGEGILRANRTDNIWLFIAVFYIFWHIDFLAATFISA